MQLKWCQYLSLSCEEWPGTQLVEAYKFCITTHFSALLCKIGSCECRVDQQDMKEGGFLYIHFIKPCSPSLCPPPTATHSQIMLLHSLKKANYQLPLLITDSGVPPLSNSTEVKVQVCVCKKNKMHCSSAHSHRASLLVLLATLLLALLCKYHQNHTHVEKMEGMVYFLMTLFKRGLILK